MSGYAELLASQGRHEEAMRVLRPRGAGGLERGGEDTREGCDDSKHADVHVMDTDGHGNVDRKHRGSDAVEDEGDSAEAEAAGDSGRNNVHMTLEQLLENEEYLEYIDEYLNGRDQDG